MQASSLQTKCLATGEPLRLRAPSGSRLFLTAYHDLRLAMRREIQAGRRSVYWGGFDSERQTVVIDICILPLWKRFPAWRKVGEF